MCSCLLAPQAVIPNVHKVSQDVNTDYLYNKRYRQGIQPGKGLNSCLCFSTNCLHDVSQCFLMPYFPIYPNPIMVFICSTKEFYGVTIPGGTEKICRCGTWGHLGFSGGLTGGLHDLWDFFQPKWFVTLWYPTCHSNVSSKVTGALTEDIKKSVFLL